MAPLTSGNAASEFERKCGTDSHSKFCGAGTPSHLDAWGTSILTRVTSRCAHPCCGRAPEMRGVANGPTVDLRWNFRLD